MTWLLKGRPEIMQAVKRSGTPALAPFEGGKHQKGDPQKMKAALR
jgi:hypothetical protein